MSSTDTSNGTPIGGAVALVTGGNRGFGRALVDDLLERGAAKVDVSSRSGHPQPNDHRVVPLILDVTDDASVAAATQSATDVSILVNNAGISRPLHAQCGLGDRGAGVQLAGNEVDHRNVVTVGAVSASASFGGLDE